MENSGTDRFTIAAIPYKNIVYVEVPFNGTVSIIDIRGQVVKKNVNGTVNISGLGNRLYFFVMRINGKISGAKKFIIIR